MGACSGSLFIAGFAIFVIGVILIVEGSTQCGDGAVSVSSPFMESNPEECSKCVVANAPWQCIDEYEMDTVLFVVGLVMIIPSATLCCFGGKVLFDDDDTENALLS